MEALAADLPPTQARFWSRGYQRRFLGAFARQEVKRFFTVWHRRAGKDDCMLNALIQHIATQEERGHIGAYWYLFPEAEEARKALWKNICGHNIRQIDHVPPDARAEGDWPLEGDMVLPFRGGSIIQVMGARFPNRIRGPNPRGIVFSEWAQMNPGAWDVCRSILNENGGWAVFNTTPFGNNHAARMWRMAQEDPAWFTDLRTVDQTRRDSPTDRDTFDDKGRPRYLGPVITPEAIEQERREGATEEFLLQEYWCSWSGVMTGSYFGLEIEQARKDGRVGRVPHEPQLPVSTFWDLGWRHALVVWFIQKLGRERRVIDCLVQLQGSLGDAFAALGRGPRAGYNYAEHWVPHDARVHELGTGKARLELFEQALGKQRVHVVPEIGFDAGIQAVHNVLPRCWFNASTVGERPLDALVSYHREYDELRGIYGSRPYDDWTCDYADAFRMFAVAEKDDPKAKNGGSSRPAGPSSPFSV